MSTRKNRIDGLGASLLVSFSALLGLNQVCVKLVNVGMNPAFQAGLRSLAAFLVVWLFASMMKKPLSIKDGSLYPGVLAGVIFAAEFLLLFQALDYTTVSRVSVLFYTMPFWVAIGAHFLVPGERLNTLKCVGLSLAVAAVLFTLSDVTVIQNDESASREFGFLTQSMVGDVFCLLAAIGWAAIALLVRTTQLGKSSPEMQLLYQLAVSAPILLLVAAYGGEMLRTPTLTHWLIFAFQVVVVVSIGFLTWFWVLSVYPVANMAVYSFLAPVFGVFFGWLILDEPLTLNILAALLVIAIGIALVNWPGRTLLREEEIH